MPRRDLIIISIAYLLCCTLFFLWSIKLTEPGFPLDDSWIHQVFARNIAAWHGFSFNSDQPVAGATAPLWTLILALAWRVAGPVGGGIAAGIIFEWLALVGLYKLAEMLTNNRFVSLITVLISVVCWPVIWGSLSGMEVGLYSALTFWGIYFYFRSGKLSDKYSYLSYFLLALAFLARPETAVFLAAFFLHDLLKWLKNEPKLVLPWLIRILVVIAPLLPYFIFNYSTTGTLFPLTYTAKVQEKGLISSIMDGNLTGIVKSLTIFPFYYLQDFYQKILSINPIAVFAAAAGFFGLIGSEGGTGYKRAMLIWSVLLYVPLMGVFVPLYSPAFQNYRMAANLIPLLILVGVTGLFPPRLPDISRFRKILVILTILFVAAGLAIEILIRIFGDKVVPLLLGFKSDPQSAEYIKMFRYGVDAARGALVIGVMTLAGFLTLSREVRKLQAGIYWRPIVTAVALIAGLATLIPGARLYADNVRNVNQCDVAAGRFLKEIARSGNSVAASDVGAVGYFSGMEVIDLKGLISPGITVDMIQNDSLAFNYLYTEKRVDFLAIAPNWFDYIPRRTDIFIPIKDFVTENNTILAGDTTRIYVAVWPRPIPDTR